MNLEWDIAKLDFRTRIDAVELLDAGAGNQEDVAMNLAEMSRINRYLGGVQALTRHLHPLLASVNHPVTILDLGTGSGDLLALISRWARRNELSVRMVGLDWAERNLAVARKHGDARQNIFLLRADARCLPLVDEGVDFILSSLFLHHFNPAEAVGLLRLAYAKAHEGIVMSDLVRGWLPYLAFRLIQPVFARHPITRYDGALSIRRGYTPHELAALARAAGIPNFRVYSHWPWRMTLVAPKGNME
jgi:SAM-dependent methyltransferase